MTPAPLCNVARHLASAALNEPHRLAVACPQGRDRDGRTAYTRLTFLQLHRESDRLANALEAVGVRRGTRTALMVPPSLDFFSLTFALFKVAAVPVLIDPGMGVRNLGKCLDDARPESFIGVPKAHLARKLIGWGRRSVRINVCTRRSRLLAEFDLPTMRKHNRNTTYSMPHTTTEDLAAILFTSGSTGPAKGACYTHGIFEAQLEALRKAYDIRPGEIDLATFPLFALFAPALGMSAVIPDMDPTKPAKVDPRKIMRAVEDFGVTNLFGSPALIDRLSRSHHTDPTKMTSLKRAISAGAPVPSETIERFQKMLPPGCEIHTPYGATEALPVASIGSRELLADTRRFTAFGAGVCIGKPVERMEARIIAIRDEAIGKWDESLTLPAGKIGEIVVHGDVVTQEYDANPEATKRAKIRDPKSGRMRHRIGDLGYFDSMGRLWFCGRKTQRVDTAKGMLHTIPCEAVFNAHPMVFRSALVGVRHSGAAYPVLIVELEKGPSTHGPDINRELMHLAKMHRHTKAITGVLVHPSFPVDIRHNSKIFREKLTLWAESELRRRKWKPEPLVDQIEEPPTFDELKAAEAAA